LYGVAPGTEFAVSQKFPVETAAFGSNAAVVGSPFVDPITGNFGSVSTYTGEEVPAGEWLSEGIPTPPYASGAPNAEIGQFGAATTAAFDPNAAVSTGNFWLTANSVPGAAPYNPLTLSPTQNGQITVTLSPPNGTTGQLVQGVIYIESMNGGGPPVQFTQITGSPDELIAIPYKYYVS
jgi:hypothetical protein